MSSLNEQLMAVVAKAKARQARMFITMHTETHRSVVEGSELTGAPGQPVDTGFLKGSWIPEILSPTVAQSVTNVSYARVIEDNTKSSFDERGVDRPEPAPSGNGGGSQHQKSTVGGNHSVKITRANMDRIAAYALQEAIEAIP